MTAPELLNELRRRGFSLAPEGAGIRIRPASRLPPDLRNEILVHKPGLRSLLQSAEAQADAALCRIIEHDQGLSAGSIVLRPARPVHCPGCPRCGTHTPAASRPEKPLT
jgi:hypothetical protein